MKTIQKCILLLLLTVVIPQTIYRDDFSAMDNWTPLVFPKIEKHTQYKIAKDSDDAYLSAMSNASASGLIWKQEFNPFETPVFEWQWKIDHVLKHGDARTREGDDYPIRIYIIFAYDPDKAGFFDSVLYESARLIYGEYPPHSSLNYIWANRQQKDHIIPNAYTDKAMMFVLQQGNGNAGQWVTEKVNILQDYRKAFGEDPPGKASVAIMADTDNTGESAGSYVNYIEIRSK